MKGLLKQALGRKDGITKCAFFLALFALATVPLRACTIFVLTDTNTSFFCNNEDWSDTRTKIWFIPAGKGYYGAVYVGFDGGWAQGGMNTEGLSFDWVAGYSETWHPNPDLPNARGNSSQRMLESCATVDEAVAFYRHHRESGFWRAKILVADRTGASVIIGAKDGKLEVERDNQCRGFGYGHEALDAALEKHPEPSAANGFKILRDCRQRGKYSTKYSNVFDMKNGDIFLYPFPDRDDEVKLNLAVELKKGGHYYDMPNIHEELAQSPQPLLWNMKRFPIDEYKPIPDKEPEFTAHIRAMLQDLVDGKARRDDYTADEWKDVQPKLKQIQNDLKHLGSLDSLTLVHRGEEKGQRIYLYRMEFANMTVLQRVVFDANGKFVDGNSEATESKPGAPSDEEGRVTVDNYKPIPDKEPKITAHLRSMVQDWIDGNPHEDDYTAQAWKEIAPQKKKTQASLSSLGGLTSMTLVDRNEEDGRRIYRYRVDFAIATVLLRVAVDAQDKFAGGTTEAYEVKPAAYDAAIKKMLGPAGEASIGIELNPVGRNLLIKGVVPGSPAAAHKEIHAGDRLLAVAQQEGPAVPVQIEKLAETVARIRGRAGTSVRLTIASPEEDDAHAKVVTVVRTKFEFPATKSN